MSQDAFWNISVEPQLINQLIDISKDNILESLEQSLRGLELSSGSFCNLDTCSNYSITSYVKILVFHFFEKVNKGSWKMLNVNY